jgi:hypothetical protein
MEPEISQADLGLTIFSQASWKDLALFSLQMRPIRLKLYAATTPNSVHSAAAGTRALGSSARKATPDGSDSTPAPMMLLARLNVDVAIVAVPPEGLCSTSGSDPPLKATASIERGMRPSMVDLFRTMLLALVMEAKDETATQLVTTKNEITLIPLVDFCKF